MNSLNHKVAVLPPSWVFLFLFYQHSVTHQSFVLEAEENVFIMKKGAIAVNKKDLTIGPCITPIWAPPAFSSKPPAIWAAKFWQQKEKELSEFTEFICFYMSCGHWFTLLLYYSKLRCVLCALSLSVHVIQYNLKCLKYMYLLLVPGNANNLNKTWKKEFDIPSNTNVWLVKHFSSVICWLYCSVQS